MRRCGTHFWINAMCFAGAFGTACRPLRTAASEPSHDIAVPAPVQPRCYEVTEQQWEDSTSNAQSLQDKVPPKRFELGLSPVSEWNPRPRLMRSLMHWPVSTQWGWGGWERMAATQVRLTWYGASSVWGQFEIIERADSVFGKGFGAPGEKARRQRSTFKAVEISCDRARDLIRPGSVDSVDGPRTTVRASTRSDKVRAHAI